MTPPPKLPPRPPPPPLSPPLSSRTERQWCDLAMSLSLLAMCERGLKRLQECWECYSDKLTEPGVFQPLLSITAKLRRGAKPLLRVPTTTSTTPFIPLP